MIGRLLCLVRRHSWVTIYHRTEAVHGQHCDRPLCRGARWMVGPAAAKTCPDCYRLKLRKVLKASKKLGRQNRSAHGLR